MKARALSSMLVAAIAVAPLAALAEPGQFYLNPFVGKAWHDSETDLDNSTFYGIGFEKQFTKDFGVELQYMKDTDAEFGGIGNGGADIDRIGVDGIYYTPSFSIFQPYLKLGVDHVTYDISNASNDNGTEVVAGLGARLLFNEHWSARLEAKALHQLDDSLTNGLVSLGISYAFGDKAKPVPVAAVKPAPVVAPAPVDTDGDGVTDDLDKCPNTPRGREVDSVGCEYHLTKTEEMKLDILFVTNKSDITEQYVGEVERAAKFLKRYADVKAVIEGHTDSDGSDAYNQKLSQRRADAVKDALVTRYGIDAARLSAVGHGESRPVASNATKEGKAQNRRVIAVMQAETTVPVMKQ
jgi:OmpA-OmpF porin, OOP family